MKSGEVIGEFFRHLHEDREGFVGRIEHISDAQYMGETVSDEDYPPAPDVDDGDLIGIGHYPWSQAARDERLANEFTHIDDDWVQK